MHFSLAYALALVLFVFAFSNFRPFYDFNEPITVFVGVLSIIAVCISTSQKLHMTWVSYRNFTLYTMHS